MIFIFIHYSCFTVFCQYSTAQHGDPVTRTGIHYFFSHYHAPSKWPVFPVLQSRISLLINSKGNSLHLLTPSSQSTPLPHLPLGNHRSILQVHDFLFCGKFHLCHILDSRYKWYHMVCLSLSDLLHLIWESLVPSMFLQMALFCSEWVFKCTKRYENLQRRLVWNR